MVYKRRVYKKRATRKGKVSAPVKKYVKNQLGRTIETKCTYFAASKNDISTDPLLYDLSTLDRGTQSFQFIGDQVKAKRLDVRFELFQNATLFLSPDQHNNIRVIIFQWRPRREEDIPHVYDILEYVSMVTNDYTIAQYNYDRKEDYKIMYDKTYILTAMPVYTAGAINAVTYYTYSESQKLGKASFYGKRIPNKNIEYSNEANTGKNHIYMLVVSDSDFTPNPQISMTARFLYSDG